MDNKKFALAAKAVRDIETTGQTLKWAAALGRRRATVHFSDGTSARVRMDYVRHLLEAVKKTVNVNDEKTAIESKGVPSSEV
jgi:hypothetical protein